MTQKNINRIRRRPLKRGCVQPVRKVGDSYIIDGLRITFNGSSNQWPYYRVWIFRENQVKIQKNPPKDRIGFVNSYQERTYRVFNYLSPEDFRKIAKYQGIGPERATWIIDFLSGSKAVKTICTDQWSFPAGKQIYELIKEIMENIRKQT